jgi:hypothetical protein
VLQIFSDEPYYTKNKMRCGPVTSGQLKALADAGTLLPSDTVWREGTRRWQLAGKVKGLFRTALSPIMRAVPPPLPVSPPNLTSAKEPLGPAATVARQLVDQGHAGHRFIWILPIGAFISVCVLGLLTAGVIALVHPDFKRFSISTQSQVADGAGMGLSEDRVLGEGTKMGRFEAATEKLLHKKLVKEQDSSDMRTYRLGETVIEIRGPRDNVTGVYVRTRSGQLGKADEHALTQTAAATCLLSTIFNPSREEGKVDYIVEWLTRETGKWAKNPKTPHRAEKVVDRLVVVANFDVANVEIQIRPRR